MRHLLVTNDYPPKLGGIQNYLWELYRRQPPDEVAVLTRPHPGDLAWDARQGHRIIRTRQPFLLPEPWLGRQIRALVQELDVELIMFDPAVPVGALGPRLGLPYGLILHGAEVTVPGRLPGTRALLGETLRDAELVITAGDYSTAEAERAAGQSLPVVVVPPGVDTDRFSPLGADERARARESFGVEPDALVVLALSRLVPRKGFDVLIDAAALLAPSHPSLVVLVVGAGRDRRRLERRVARVGAPVRFLGRAPDAAVPTLYGISDVFSMLCRVRWGGLEQEGFGIVFLEAAAASVPQLAGRSGGAAEAVVHGVTGLVIDDPGDLVQVTESLRAMLDDDRLREQMGQAARRRAGEDFDYDRLAARFRSALVQAATAAAPERR